MIHDQAFQAQEVADADLGVFFESERDPEAVQMAAFTSKDNLASLRVLETCSFRVVGEATGFANVRGAEIEELVLELTAWPTRWSP